MYLADEHLRGKSPRKSCCLAALQSSPQYFTLPPQHRVSALLESSFPHQPSSAGQKGSQSTKKCSIPIKDRCIGEVLGKGQLLSLWLLQLHALCWKAEQKTKEKDEGGWGAERTQPVAVAEGNTLVWQTPSTRSSHSLWHSPPCTHSPTWWHLTVHPHSGAGPGAPEAGGHWAVGREPKK